MGENLWCWKFQNGMGSMQAKAHTLQNFLTLGVRPEPAPGQAPLAA